MCDETPSCSSTPPVRTRARAPAAARRHELGRVPSAPQFRVQLQSFFCSKVFDKIIIPRYFRGFGDTFDRSYSIQTVLRIMITIIFGV